MKQLNLFDETIRFVGYAFDVGDVVKIPHERMEAKKADDSELYYYLQDYAGQTGVITRQCYSRTGVYYEIQMKERVVICYETELVQSHS